MAHIAGLVAAGLHPSPFPHADLVTTTTHKTLRGPRGGLIFSRRELPPTVDAGDFPAVKGTLAAAVDKTVFPGIQGGPLMHVIAGKAVALQAGRGAARSRRTSGGRSRTRASWPTTLAGPGARLVSGGTDNHLMLVDVTPLGVTGKEAEHLLDEIGITVNKNAIPFDPLPAEHGVGHPDRDARDHVARVRRRRDARRSARIIIEAIRERDEPATQARLAGEVREIVDRFPVPGLPAA